jgi:hypothetical protein
MKFCPVVSEICNGHVHVARKERIIIIIIIIITKIIIIIRNGAKTISLQTLFGRLKYLHRLKTKFINISQNILEK